MAQQWIKFATNTSDKPEVWAMAQALGIDPDAVVGKLLRVWAWFDAHSETGNAPSVTRSLLDRVAGVAGFTNAMIAVFWMTDDGTRLELPNFDRHNGQTAKRRALTANRVEKSREDCNAASVTKSVTRALPDKRREEEKNNTYTHTQAALPSSESAEIPGQPHWSQSLLVPFGWPAEKTIELLTRWDNFQQARHGAPLVDIQANEILRKAISMGWDMAKFEEAIGDSIRCGWKSIHLEAEMKARQSAKPAKKKNDIADVDLSQPM